MIRDIWVRYMIWDIDEGIAMGIVLGLCWGGM